MKIKILGTNCSKCNTLFNNTRIAAEELKLHSEILKVENIEEMLAYPILRTPAMVINEKLIFSGIVPEISEIKQILIAHSDTVL